MAPSTQTLILHEMLSVPSSEGVGIALHHLAGDAGAQPLLIAHATGFNGHCYMPIAEQLADRFDCWALDFRGHGATDVDPAWDVDWRRFGDDALAAARHVAPDGGLVAFGHSMGGAALLMAAHRSPSLFDRLVLFEPISHEATGDTPTADDMRQLPIVQGALRRSRTFPSFEAANENYASKPPLSLMVPEALRNYIAHGFRPAVDDDGRPVVELRCVPELEAAIFVTGRQNGVWELLPEIETPCLVIGGHVDQGQPSHYAEPIAARLPNGRYALRDEQTHFGPFSHPAATADLIGVRPRAHR